MSAIAGVYALPHMRSSRSHQIVDSRLSIEWSLRQEIIPPSDGHSEDRRSPQMAGGTLTASQAVFLPPVLIFPHTGHFLGDPEWQRLAVFHRFVLRRN